LKKGREGKGTLFFMDERKVSSPDRKPERGRDSWGKKELQLD